MAAPQCLLRRPSVQPDQNTIPFGYCHCGCGQKTKIARQTWAPSGWVKGHPLKYIYMHHRRLSAVEYIVDGDSGCWIWQRQVNNKGYGVIGNYRKGERKLAHVWFYEQRFGPVPQGCELDHRCEKPRCCNPDHLDPVSHIENVRRGGSAKLTIEQAREIRELRGLMSHSKIAQRFGISASQVCRVQLGQYWKDGS